LLIEGQLAAEDAAVDSREAHRHHADAHAPLPRFSHQHRQHGIDVLLKIARLIETQCPRHVLHVVVAELHRHRAETLAILAHLGREAVGDTAELGEDEGVIGHVLRKRVLLTVAFGIGLFRHDGSLIHAVREGAELRRIAADEQREQIGWRARDLLYDRQTGGVQHTREFRPDTRQPFVRQRGEKTPLFAIRHFEETRGLAQLRRDLRHEFVRGDAFRDDDFEALPNGPSDRLRDFARRVFALTTQIEIALVNRRDFHLRREVVGVGKHEPREPLILLEIARQHDEPLAELAGASSGHRRVNAELARFVARGGDDAAPVAADRDRFASQLRIGGLFD